MMLVFFSSTEIVASEARTVLFNESNKFACGLVLAIVGLTHERSSLEYIHAPSTHRLKNESVSNEGVGECSR